MSDETTQKDKLVAIRDKIKELIEADTSIILNKVYKGTPNSIPNYPAILLDYTDDEAEQTHKGKFKITETHQMSIIVLNKYLDYPKRQDDLLTLTGQLKKLIVTNRYLNGIRAADGSWRHQDMKLIGTRFEALVKPKTFVLDSSEIRIAIVTEGI